MTRDEIISMAWEAGLGHTRGTGWLTHAGTQRFARLVAAAERDACASISPNDLSVLASDLPHVVWEKYRAAIKARSAA